MPEANKHEPQLKRSLGFVLITLYGLGTTVGAGIYVLIGKVGERAGLFAPWSFLLASLIAAFTAFTFAELASRHPKSAYSIKPVSVLNYFPLQSQRLVFDALTLERNTFNNIANSINRCPFNV